MRKTLKQMTDREIKDEYSTLVCSTLAGEEAKYMDKGLKALNEKRADELNGEFKRRLEIDKHRINNIFEKRGFDGIAKYTN
jgi:hypothetical protein